MKKVYFGVYGYIINNKNILPEDLYLLFENKENISKIIGLLRIFVI